MSASSHIVLRSAEFRKGRERAWQELEALITRVEKRGIISLTAEESGRLPILYRNVMSSLSVGRNISLDRNLLLYLEDLSLRAYLAVYGPRTGVLKNIKTFFQGGFSQAVRSIRWHLLTAFLLMAAGVAAGFFIVTNDISAYNIFVPADLADGRGPGSTPEELRDIIFAPFTGFWETLVLFTNILFTHNTGVGILCFSLGFALGVPTMLLLIYNGLVLGAFVGLHYEKGLTVECIGWLSIHGVTEIFAIILCAAAGLLLAEKIVFPDRLTRLESLAKHGRKAGAVVAGAIALFFIAGILEGVFRQLFADTSLRFLTASLTAVFWIYYFAVYKGKGIYVGKQ